MRLQNEDLAGSFEDSDLLGGWSLGMATIKYVMTFNKLKGFLVVVNVINGMAVFLS